MICSILYTFTIVWIVSTRVAAVLQVLAVGKAGLPRASVDAVRFAVGRFLMWVCGPGLDMNIESVCVRVRACLCFCAHVRDRRRVSIRQRLLPCCCLDLDGLV